MVKANSLHKTNYINIDNLKARILFINILVFISTGYCSTVSYNISNDSSKLFTLKNSSKIGEYIYSSDMFFSSDNDYFYFSTFKEQGEQKRKIEVSRISKTSLIEKKPKIQNNIYIHLPDSVYYHSINAMKHELVVFQDKYVVLLGMKKIMTFQSDNNKDYYLKSTHSTQGSFSGIKKISNDEILLYEFYNFHPLSNDSILKISTYSLKDDCFKILKAENSIRGKELTHLVNNFIDYNLDILVVANPLSYLIDIYNYSNDTFTLSGSIKNNKINMSGLNKYLPEHDDLNFNLLNVKQKLKTIDSILLNEKTQRIQKVFVIDSNTILVSIIDYSNLNIRKIDIWQKDNNNKWSIKLENYNHDLFDKNIFEDQIKIQYSLPILFYKNNAFMISYNKPEKKSKKKRKKGYYLLRYEMEY